jgi:hypothetical protein
VSKESRVARFSPHSPSLFAGVTLFIVSLAAQPMVSTQDSVAPSPLLIQDVNVVDVDRAIVLPGRDVLISGGHIRQIGPAGTLPPPLGAAVVHGANGFLMPGLMDMHAHLRGGPLPGWVSTDWFMPLLLAHGITGVRDMTSDCDKPGPGIVCLDQMVEWKRQIDAGERLGPRLLALSTARVSPPWDREITEEEARAFVQHAAKRGAQLVKVYQSVTPASFVRLMNEARQQHLVVGGHIPLRLTISEASRHGLRSVEHARDFLFDCFPGSAEFRRTSRSLDPPTSVLQAMVRDHDPRACDQIFRTMVANETWYVPTHLTRRFEAFAGDPDFRADPRLRYVPEWLRRDWLSDADATVKRDATPAGAQARTDFYLKGLSITGAAHRAGVRTVLGTDAGDSFVFPGSSAHDELGELVAAGLSPAAALRAATLSAAEFLGLAAIHGSVDAGKRADLVLVSANPLEDITNVRGIRAVIFGGRVLNREQLDNMLAAAEATAARPLSQP